MGLAAKTGLGGRARAIASVQPAPVSDEVADLFADQIARSGVVSNFSRVLAHAPAALRGWRTINHGVRLKYVDDPAFLQIEELSIIRTSTLNCGRYCLSHNIGLGKDIGLSDEQIEAARGDYETSSCLSERQKAAIRWAEAVTLLKAGEDEKYLAEMRSHFTEKEIVELTIVSCMWNFSNRFCEALGIELEPEGERLHFVHG